LPSQQMLRSACSVLALLFHAFPIGKRVGGTWNKVGKLFRGLFHWNKRVFKNLAMVVFRLLFHWNNCSKPVPEAG